jgi:hypothetical protein
VPREHPLELGELIDLELRFAADRELEAATLRERDERIGRRILAGHDGLARHELFRRWLAALHVHDEPSVGARIQAGYRLLGAGLTLAAVVIGAAAARAVLDYDGTQPVNVVHFLAVFVAAQIALVAVAVVAMVPQLLGHLPVLSPLQEAIRVFTYRRSRGAGGGHTVGGTTATLARAAGLGTVYGRVERWLLLALTQRTAFFFNVGALATCIYLITFTDLAFAWSTTLDVSAETMTRLLRGVALPWRWLDAATPSPDLVSASRYFRNSAAYDARMLKDWWAFLLAALVAYGLCPRLLLWRIAAWRLRRSRASLALDHGEAEVAFERLTRSTHGWTGGQAAPAATTPATTLASQASAALPKASGSACTIVRWADVPLDTVAAGALAQRRFGWRAEGVFDSGGRDGAREREDLLRRLAAEPEARPVMLIAESWEAPSRAVTAFLRELRAAAGPRRPFIVALVDARDGGWRPPSDDDSSVWRSVLATLADPYLRLEPVAVP